MIVVLEKMRTISSVKHVSIYFREKTSLFLEVSGKSAILFKCDWQQWMVKFEIEESEKWKLYHKLTFCLFCFS
jgi:hypothetical protein